MQFCPKNIGKTCVFIFEQKAHKLLWAISSKMKTRILSKFLGQKMFDIKLNTQFCLKNFGKTRVFIFEEMARKIL